MKQRTFVFFTVFILLSVSVIFIAVGVSAATNSAKGQGSSDEADRLSIERLHQQDVAATLSDKADELAKLWDDAACSHSARQSSRDRQGRDLRE